MTTLHYKASFERLGARHGAHDVTFDVRKGPPVFVADQLTDAIARYARKRIASKEFDVEVGIDDTLQTGEFWVEFGRFGRGELNLLAELEG